MVDQGEFFSVPSPCQRICEMNSKGYCIGCFRNRNERLHWNQFTEFQKQLVVNLCHKRKLKVLQAKQMQSVAQAPEEDLSEQQLDLFHEATLMTEESPKKPNKKTPPPAREEEQLDLF